MLPRGPAAAAAPIWQLLATACSELIACSTSNSAPEISPRCDNDLDCMLNGQCQNHLCRCDAGWTGELCERLDVMPTEPELSKQRAYPPQNGTASWGGNPLQDVKTGAWHLYVSPVANQCGMECWNTQQYIQHAVSTTGVQGPYHNAANGGTVQSLMSTNPQAALTKNGSVLVAHIGRGKPLPNPGLQPWSNCTGGSTPCCHGPSELRSVISSVSSSSPSPSPGCTNAGAPCTIMWPSAATGILSAPSFDGPWTDHVDTIPVPQNPEVRPWPMASKSGLPPLDNPSPVVLENGTLLVMHVLRIAQAEKNTANFVAIARNQDWANDKGWEPVVGTDFARPMISTSTPYRGSCNASWGVVTPSGRRLRCPQVSEDPYFWQDARGNFHALFHFDGATHAFSPDAIQWFISPHYAYTPEVQHTDGTHTEYISRERPKLALDPSHKAPLAIISAVRAPWLDQRCAWGSRPHQSVHDPFCDSSFTHIQLVRGNGSLSHQE